MWYVIRITGIDGNPNKDNSCYAKYRYICQLEPMGPPEPPNIENPPGGCDPGKRFFIYIIKRRLYNLITLDVGALSI